MDSTVSLDILPGTVDLLLLKTLSWGPRHGYGVSQWIRQETNGRLGLEDAALYQALHRLERQEVVTSEWGLSDQNRRARFYQLTDKGRRRLTEELSQWHAYAAAVGSLLSATPCGGGEG